MFEFKSSYSYLEHVFLEKKTYSRVCNFDKKYIIFVISRKSNIAMFTAWTNITGFKSK